MCAKHQLVAVIGLFLLGLVSDASAATGSLLVKVMDEESKPVAITRVQLWVKTATGGGQAFDFSAQPTDTPGTFRVSGVPAGHYEGVQINEPGYAPGRTEEVQIDADRETAVSCTLSRGGTIEGRVTDEAGKPVEGIPVVVNSVLCRRDVVTDETGRFVAEHLSNTKYSIIAEPKADSPYAVSILTGGASCGAKDLRLALKRKSDVIREALIGKPAPAPVVEQWYNGSFWQLNLNNKAVLLDFWGVGYRPCRRQIPQIRALAAKYADEGLVVIAIHTQDGKQDLPSFLTQNDVPYLIGVDFDNRTAEAYRVSGYPTIVLIDRKGTIRAVDPLDLEKEVIGLLAKADEQTPRP